MRRTLQILTTLVAALALLAIAAPLASASGAFEASTTKIPVSDPPPPAGAQVLKYKFGPVKIEPGQNLIKIDVQKQRPAVDGWIVGFRPGLVNVSDGKSPPVTEVHLHHAVWLVDLKPAFAAGEEKTYFNAAPGFGWRYTTKQSWIVNHMIHDLTPTPKEVYITYTLVLHPRQRSAGRVDHEDLHAVDGRRGRQALPGLQRAARLGQEGALHLPDDAKNPYPDGKIRNRWVVDHDTTLVNTAGHLHPGGLYTDLNVTRDGKTVRIFRSRAQYFEPAGAVSWDVAMSATSKNWRVALKKGDVVTTTATYDTTKASWYEVMGIMVVGITDGPDGGVDPFTGTVDQTDYLTHGRLKENIDIGIRKPNPGLSDPRKLRDGPLVDKVVIKNFTYQQGDLSLTRQEGPAGDDQAGPAADVRQRGLAAHGALPHDHRMQDPLQPDRRDRLPAARRCTHAGLR